MVESAPHRALSTNIGSRAMSVATPRRGSPPLLPTSDRRRDPDLTTCTGISASKPFHVRRLRNAAILRLERYPGSIYIRQTPAGQNRLAPKPDACSTQGPHRIPRLLPGFLVSR